MPTTTRHLELPARLAGLALRPMPPQVLEPLLGLAMRLALRRHPRLIERLAELAPARIIIEPRDTRHRFLIDLSEGDAPVRLMLAQEDDEAQATISGRLAALIDLMEGRIDGDSLFFTRDLSVTGDTALIVALRNTLDGEEISLLDDVLAFLGPFAPTAARLIGLADDAAKRLAAKAGESLQALHAMAHGRHDPEAEAEALRQEVAALKSRLSKLESRASRAKEAAPA
ncbi:MAG: SCP2 sterol-binding domain-containing protein [Alphaproteobacteria bacterium]|nr:SCP2 sterol-binding domain-containing protein [Alphaproteobacteria bacterium]